MPVNKNVYRRYKIIDTCLRDLNRTYTYENMLEVVNTKLRYIDCDTIQIRQLKYDLNEFESKEEFVKIKQGKKRILRYENTNCPFPFNYLNDWIKTSIDDMQKLLAEPEFSDKPIFRSMSMLISHIPILLSSKIESKFLEFDDNPFLKGIEYFDRLLYSILNKMVLNIEYEPYDKSPIMYVTHPYSIKQYNNRWFLICSTDSHPNVLSILPVDRIKSIDINENVPYRENQINIDEYFEDIVGITVPNTEVVKVKLKISEKRYPYIESKPIHSSQTELKSERTEGYRVISIKVKPNRELETLISSYSDDIEVLEPEFLREKFRNKIYNLYNKYNPK